MIRFQKPVKDSRSSVVFPALMAYWFAFSFYPMGSLHHHLNSFETVMAIFMGSIAAIAWLLTTPPRLEDLRLKRFWMLPLALPFVIAIGALWSSRHVIGWTFLILGVAAQGMLVFMAPFETSTDEAIDSADAGGQR